MLSSLLLFTTLLHCVYTLDYTDPVLYKAIQKAVVKDESNMTPGNSNKQIQFSIPECFFTVKSKIDHDYLPYGWNNCSRCDSDLSTVGYYCYNESLHMGNYSEVQSKLFPYVIATTYLLDLIELYSVRLFDLLTNQNLADTGSFVTDCKISINIDDELDSLHGYSAVRDTLQTVFVWVYYID